MIEVRWLTPATLTANYTQTIISRSRSENGVYEVRHRFDTTQNGFTVTSWVDPDGGRNYFYTIKYFDPATQLEFYDYALGFFPLLPREKRLVSYIISWLPDMYQKEITDFDINIALRLSLNHFNIYPPETNFTMSSFPANYEQYLITGAQINLAFLKYLKISIRDFGYSDMGFSINIDRGTKIGKVAGELEAIYNATIERAKWNFINQGLGLGSVPLPVGIGANLNRSQMNVLDLMTAQSR
jgi:hypothetical protein